MKGVITNNGYIVLSQQVGEDNLPKVILGESFLVKEDSESELFKYLMDRFGYSEFLKYHRGRDTNKLPIDTKWEVIYKEYCEKLKEDLRNSKVEITITFKNILSNQ